MSLPRLLATGYLCVGVLMRSDFQPFVKVDIMALQKRCMIFLHQLRIDRELRITRRAMVTHFPPVSAQVLPKEDTLGGSDLAKK